MYFVTPIYEFRGRPDPILAKLPQLGVSGKGTRALFRLTMMEMGKGKTRQAPTKEPERWKEGVTAQVFVIMPTCRSPASKT